MKSAPDRGEYFAAILNVLILACILWGVIRVARRRSGKIALAAQAALLLFALIPLKAVVGTLIDYFPAFTAALTSIRNLAGGSVKLFSIVLLIVLPLLFFGRRRLLPAAFTLLLVCAPFTLVTFGNAARAAFTRDTARFADKPLAPPLPLKPGMRVVWVIFDEWDYSLTFPNRPESIHLPEFDRFRQIALSAENAFTPGPATAYSIPGLITGRPVQSIEAVDSDRYLIQFRDSSLFEVFGQQPTVFSRAREAGFNAAIYGWDFPYCRIFNTQVTGCAWEDLNLPSTSNRGDFHEILWKQDRSLLETQFRSFWGQSLSARETARDYVKLIEAAKIAVADPAVSLVYIHLPVPHPPYYYNRRTRRFDFSSIPVYSLFEPAVRGYLDALELADSTARALRETLQNAGQWDRTAVLLSADHSFRHAERLTGKPQDPRVPFLLRLPGQSAGMHYTPRFETVRTADLVIELLAGRLGTPTDVLTWMQRDSRP
jgi:hypothetical protein